MRINNPLKIILVLVAVVAMISATLPAQNKFKNLKVLPKNISEAQLDKYMDHFDVSLGVGCDFCHAKKKNVDELDFASDKKPEKEIARQMMTMTSGINARYFNFADNKTRIIPLQAITCFTCHRGSPRVQMDSIPTGN